MLFIIFVFILFYIHNMKAVYRLQKKQENGEYINTFKDDMRVMVNGKFHITLLTLPTLGVIVMNILPILVLIAVAFTNYDQNHMPPNALFHWVGFANFKSLFSNSMTITFGYAFLLNLEEQEKQIGKISGLDLLTGKSYNGSVQLEPYGATVIKVDRKGGFYD